MLALLYHRPYHPRPVHPHLYPPIIVVVATSHPPPYLPIHPPAYCMYVRGELHGPFVRPFLFHTLSFVADAVWDVDAAVDNGQLRARQSVKPRTMCRVRSTSVLYSAPCAHCRQRKCERCALSSVGNLEWDVTDVMERNFSCVPRAAHVVFDSAPATATVAP
ncbi:hypothetical protein PENSPDRAFT_266903 [Peniophora sp. CONT]|nr:hypothetical protein PENSPDRAFT_266903 [Peniophora sp. CONT]